MTLNTHAWIPAASRDLHEFRDDGTPFSNSFGYRTTLRTVTLPDSPYGIATGTAGEAPVPGQAWASLVPSEDNLEVQIHGPGAGDPVVNLVGEDLIGLTLDFDMEDPGGNAYAVQLEITKHAIDPEAGDLFEFDRIDPSTGVRGPTCKPSDDVDRLARVLPGMHIDGETGSIETEVAGLRHIGCLSAAPGKAQDLGYSPGDGHSAFVLATRVVRADYCADNHPFTYPGNLFDMVDNRQGPLDHGEIAEALQPGETIEAVWSETGILCIGTARSGVSAEEIICPTKALADGTIAHNWRPPSCENFVDANPDGELRIISLTAPEPESEPEPEPEPERE